ncbi:MAG: O-antigen ligase family protein [bacterium]|nr:O-antigen ligase family protein [bacterium]
MLNKIIAYIKELYLEAKENFSGLIVVTIVLAVVIGWMLLYIDSIRGSLVISIFMIGMVSIFMNPFLGIVGMVWAFFFLAGTAWYLSGMSWLKPELMFVIVTMVCWCLKMIVSRKMYFFVPVQLWVLIGLFICMCISSLGAVYSSAISWTWNVEFLKLIIIFFVFINLINSPTRFNIVYWMIVLPCAYLSLQGCRSYVMEGYSRLEQIGECQLKGSNELASALCLSIPFLFYKFFSKKKLERMLSLLVFPIIFCIIISSSRGAMVEGAIMIILLICYTKLSPKILVLITVLAFAAIIFSPQEAWKRLKTTTDYKTEGSAVSRVELAKSGLRMWKDYPIFGVGQDNFRHIVCQYYEIPGSRQRVAHNTYIQVLSEGGVITFLFFILFLFLLFRDLRFVKKYALKESEGFQIRNMANVLEITLCGFLIDFLFGNKIYYVLPIFFYALCASLKNIVKSQGLLKDGTRL